LTYWAQLVPLGRTGRQSPVGLRTLCTNCAHASARHRPVEDFGVLSGSQSVGSTHYGPEIEAAQCI